MNSDEIVRLFDAAQKTTANLQSQYADVAKSLGQINTILTATKPYWVDLAAQSGSNAATTPIIESGKAFISEINDTLSSIKGPEERQVNFVNLACLSAASFGSNTATSSSLFTISGKTDFRVEAIPVPKFQTENTLPKRLESIDPALGKVCQEIWDTLYGTNSDPERSALYMLRQTWDHFFDKLAPDQKVRESVFWTQKEGEKPNLVTREERFRYAVDKHVVDPGKRKLLLAACSQMLELYQELNHAHERGEINKIKALRSLNSMYSWLLQWADALRL